MTEHWFLAAMLAVVGAEVAVVAVVLGYFVYRSKQICERIEGLTAATFLEVRRTLERYGSS